MKKIGLKTVAVLIVLISLLVYVLSCQKENADRELAVLKSTSGYDIKGLMKEDVVLQMLEELRPYSFTVNKIMVMFV